MTKNQAVLIETFKISIERGGNWHNTWYIHVDSKYIY